MANDDLPDPVPGPPHAAADVDHIARALHHARRRLARAGRARTVDERVLAAAEQLCEEVRLRRAAGPAAPWR